MKYIIFICIIPFIAYSQSNIEINKVEISDLSSQKINNLNLDNRNFNWISTNDGLNRYDGKINTIFKTFLFLLMLQHKKNMALVFLHSSN